MLHLSSAYPLQDLFRRIAASLTSGAAPVARSRAGPAAFLLGCLRAGLRPQPTPT